MRFHENLVYSFIPESVEIQRNSFSTLLKKGFIDELKKITPITNFTRDIKLFFYPDSYKLTLPQYTPSEAILKSKSYYCKLYVPVLLKDRQSKENKYQWVLLGHLPLMTKRGHFIINGSPRVVINQLVRSPGIYYQEKIHLVDSEEVKTYYADLISYRGAWLRLEIDKKERVWVRIKKTAKISALVFLHALGFTKRDLRSKMRYPGFFYQYLLEKDRHFSKEEALMHVYEKTLPKDPHAEKEKKTISRDEKREEKKEDKQLKKAVKETAKKIRKEKDEKKKKEIQNKQNEAAEKIQKERKEKHLKKIEYKLKEAKEKAPKGETFLFQKFKNPKTYTLGLLGRMRLNKKFKDSNHSVNENILTLTNEDILYGIDYLILLATGEKSVDDIDHLKNRRVKTSGELIQNQLETGLNRLAKIIRVLMNNVNFERKKIRGNTSKQIGDLGNSTLQKKKKGYKGYEEQSLTVKKLITTKPINGALREFLGSSPLSQYLDQTNPLAEITHKRRLSSLGPGGVSRETAGMAIRSIHPTHYGRICPIETPEGRNAGLVNSLTIHARINSDGFLKTPFYNVYQGQIQKQDSLLRDARPIYFSAEEEERYKIAPGDLKGSKLNFLPSLRRDTKIPIKIEKDYYRVSREEVEYIGMSPIQMISLATSLIPFLEHDDANRALMGSNMQRQAVPIIIPERPIVGTGLEGRVAADSGFVLQSKIGGYVCYASAKKIVILEKKNSNILSKNASYPLSSLYFGSLREKSQYNLWSFFFIFLNIFSNEFGTSFSSKTAPLTLKNSIIRSLRSLHKTNTLRKERSTSLNKNLIIQDCINKLYLIITSNLIFSKKETKNCDTLFSKNYNKKIILENNLNLLVRIGDSFHRGPFFFKKNASYLYLGKKTHNLCIPYLGKKNASHHSPNRFLRLFKSLILTPFFVKDLLKYQLQIKFSKTLYPLKLFKIKDLPYSFFFKKKSISSQEKKRRFETSLPDKNISRGLLLAGIDGIRNKKIIKTETQLMEENSNKVFSYFNQYTCLSFEGNKSLVDYVEKGVRSKNKLFWSNRKERQRFNNDEENQVFVNGTKGLFQIKDFNNLAAQGQNSHPKNCTTLAGQRKPPLEMLLPGKEEFCIPSLKQSIEITEKGTVNHKEKDTTNHNIFVKSVEHSLQNYQRSNQDTCLAQRPAVLEGDWVQKGDLLADCTSSVLGDVSLGKNILVAYMPWEGYNFEDAILISERLISDDIYTSIHIVRYEVEIRDTILGLEQIKKKLPEVPIKWVKHLDTKGIAQVGCWVKGGHILVGKITPINKKILSPHEKLLYDIFEKEVPVTRDTSLRLPKGGEGRVIGVQVLETKNIPPGIPFAGPGRVRIFIAEKRKIQVGDKISGRHGNKGIVSKIIPRQDMPYLPNGTPIDMVLNPLGVPSRMNVGQVFEALLGLAGLYLNQYFKVPSFDEAYGPQASRSLVYSKLYEARLKSGQKWLFDPNFPGKTRVFDGRTGESFDQFVTVGQAYMLKLVHLVDDKIHARSTGPYSLVTQQPLRGRAKHGGQRLGEMEVWALEGFGAAYILQEVLTIKSDDIKGRRQVIKTILDINKKGKEKNEKSITLKTPEVFKVLIRELQSLCLKLDIYTYNSLGKVVPTDLIELP